MTPAFESLSQRRKRSATPTALVSAGQLGFCGAKSETGYSAPSLVMFRNPPDPRLELLRAR
jgi:hypothetical protein